MIVTSIVLAVLAQVAPAKAELAGVVVDARGNPVVGVEVLLSSGEGGHRLARTTTDVQGRFRHDAPPPAQEGDTDIWTLWAYRPEASVATCVVDPARGEPLPGSTLRLMLGPPRSTVVRVLDPGGRPVEGAGLRPIDYSIAVDVPPGDAASSWTVPIPQAIVDRIAVRTDARGLGELAGLDPKEVQEVRIDTSRFGDQSVWLAFPEDGPTTASLAPVGRLSGRVKGPDPGRYRGIRIRVESTRNVMRCMNLQPDGHAVVTVDAAGRFDVPALAVGDLFFSLESRDGTSEYELSGPHATIEAGKTGEVTIDLGELDVMQAIGGPAAVADRIGFGVAGRAEDARINLKVLFAGNPGSDRQKDFTAFLETHFARVGTADFAKLRDADADGYDVIILDCDQSMMSVVQEGDRSRQQSPPMPRLSRDFDRPVVLIGPMGGMVAQELDLKLKWLCNCLDDAAQELVVAHPIFHEPLAVSIRLEESPTPDHYRNPWWPGGRALAPTIKTWLVQTKTYRNRREGRWEIDPGLVCEPYGFTDSPDCEVIASGRNAKMIEAIAIGRQANFLMWGFYTPPSDLTPEARKCLVNAIAYIARFDHQKPLVRRVTSDRKQWLTYTNIPDFIRDEAIYKTMFPAHLRGKFGGAVEKYAAYYRENLEFLHPTGTDHVVDVDEDVKALKLSNRKVELLETCIAMLERSDRPALALRILKRYTTEDFAEARQWRSWLTANRSRLFFTDAGGFKFRAAPSDLIRSAPSGPAPGRGSGGAG